MGVSESIEGPKHNAMRGGSPQLSINSESQGVRCTFETNVFNADIRLHKKYVLPYFSPIEMEAWIFHIQFIRIRDVRLIYLFYF